MLLIKNDCKDDYAVAKDSKEVLHTIKNSDSEENQTTYLDTDVLMTRTQALQLQHLTHHLAMFALYWERGIGDAVRLLNPSLHRECNDHLRKADRDRLDLDQELIPLICTTLAPTLPAGWSWGVKPTLRSISDL